MRLLKTIGLISIAVSLAGCGAFSGNGASRSSSSAQPETGIDREDNPGETTIWDAFGPNTNEQEVQVNRYLWTASLDVLDFLPVQSVDPFTGIIVTGFGTPPGGGRAYRATIHIKDPALDARSLNLALQTKSGPASAETTRAVEDAILSRARQLRIADGKL